MPTASPLWLCGKGFESRAGDALFGHGCVGSQIQAVLGKGFESRAWSRARDTQDELPEFARIRGLVDELHRAMALDKEVA